MRVIASRLAPPLGALIFMLLCGLEGAAEPSAEQIAAIKSNCRSDYMSYCWSVPRGGSEAAQCLKQNLAKLSPSCQQAVKAATAAAAPPSAPAVEAKPAPPAEEAPSSVPAATAKAVAPAPEPALQTQDGSDQGAPPTAAPTAKAAAPAPAAAPKTAAQTPAAEAAPATAAVKAPSATEAPPPAESAATTAAVPPSASEPPGFIPPGKKLMLVRNCRHDFKVFCPDVDLGGGRAVVCLEDNKAQLTSDCRDALAKLGR